MVTKINSAAVLGLDCIPITVEVDISGSWPGFQIVGLPDASVNESKERIRSAWKNSDLSFPSNSRIIVNLAPADVKKIGAAYDLPMAVGMLLGGEGIDADVRDAVFVGELALDGKLRHVSGVLPIAIYAREQEFKRLFVPAVNAEEACVVKGIAVYPVTSFQDIIAHLSKKQLIPVGAQKATTKTRAPSPEHQRDMADIHGQHMAKRALEIAASGGHNLLFTGPPGSGKTLLARTMPSILPDMTENESIEVTKIYSVAGLLRGKDPLVRDRPFRAPHHSSSGASLVGGGAFPRPGEVSLAHRGVLYLDELPEFSRHVLEMLRQPLEDGIVTISRAQGTLTFPAGMTLIASQNPCPCGYATDPDKACLCSPIQIARYQKKVSGPLLDRIDLHVDVPRLPFEHIASREPAEFSVTIRERVERARHIQTERFAGTLCVTNSTMGPKELRKYCELPTDALTLLQRAVASMHLSARSYHRILKVSRTIADLGGTEQITAQHVAEALQYRSNTDM